jgi:SAM-dependent methyltransferase
MPLAQQEVDSIVKEPFSAGRAAGRLIFDFGVMASTLKQDQLDYPILDFGAGTAWVSEFCARMGLKTVSFDIHGDLEACVASRIESDRRIDPGLMSFVHGDGHAMPFGADEFGHLLCYDTLHHMHSYPGVFAEFFRVLRRRGRAIFVEPGARHSQSPETVAFVEQMKKHDPTWIERDVVLEEIDNVAKSAGFVNGLTIVPMPHPLAFQTYTLQAWLNFRSGDEIERLRLTDQLAALNYSDRVIFYVDKPD